MNRQPVVKALSCAAIAVAIACRSPQREVVIHTSVDQNYTAPVFREFTQRTGVAVKPVFDVEAARTAGQEAPPADVVWNGDFVPTLLLKQRGLLARYASPSTRNLPERFVDPQNYWSCVGARCPVLIIQVRLAPPQIQTSMDLLLDPDIPSHRIGIAFPPTGTGATHAAALYAVQGKDPTRWFFQRVRARGVRVLDTSDEVRQMVSGWQLAVGLTDSDVACRAMTKDAPVKVAVPDAESLGAFLIPSTVALAKGAAHPAEARALIDFLLSADTEKWLIRTGFFQFSLRDVDTPQGCLEGQKFKRMEVSLEDVFRYYPASRTDLEQIFMK